MVTTPLGQRLRDAAAAHAAKQRCGEFDCQSSAVVWLEKRGVEVDTALASDLLFGGYAEGIGSDGETYIATIKSR
jgi:hypothetical protein